MMKKICDVCERKYYSPSGFYCTSFRIEPEYILRGGNSCSWFRKEKKRRMGDGTDRSIEELFPDYFDKYGRLSFVNQHDYDKK